MTSEADVPRGSRRSPVFVIAAALLLLALYYKTLSPSAPTSIQGHGHWKAFLGPPTSSHRLRAIAPLRCLWRRALLPTFYFCPSHLFPYTSCSPSSEDRVLLWLSPPTQFPKPRTKLNELTNKGRLLDKDKHGDIHFSTGVGNSTVSAQCSGRFTASQ